MLVLTICRPDKTLATDKYDMIRQDGGQGNSPFVNMLLPGGFRRLATQFLRNSDHESLRQLLRHDVYIEGKRHKTGCMHSGMPECVISNTAQEDSDEADKGVKGDLASSIYFKRCDGVYKNVKGEVLEME